MEEEPVGQLHLVNVKEDEFKSPSNTWLAAPQCHFWNVNLSFLLQVRMGYFELLHPDLLVESPMPKLAQPNTECADHVGLDDLVEYHL